MDMGRERERERLEDGGMGVGVRKGKEEGAGRKEEDRFSLYSLNCASSPYFSFSHPLHPSPQPLLPPLFLPPSPFFKPTRLKKITGRAFIEEKKKILLKFYICQSRIFILSKTTSYI